MGARDPRVDDYLDRLPDWQRETLQQVREVLHRAHPLPGWVVLTSLTVGMRR